VEDLERGVSTRSTLVTGASGLLGRWLVGALVERGERVVALQRTAPEPGGPAADWRVVAGDVTDAALMARIVVQERVETVFHLAAQTIVATAAASPAATFATNVQGTCAVLEAARRGGAARVVVASSIGAYGEPAALPLTEELALRPRHAYEASKAAADLIARSYWPSFGLPVATARLANVYGGGDRNPSRLIPELVAAALDGRAPHLRSDGTPQHAFLYVEDAVAAYLAIADALGSTPAARGEAFNAAGGRPISVREVVETLGRVAGAPLRATYEPARTAAPPQAVDLTKIHRVCGWAPTVDLEEGLRRTLASERERRGVERSAAER
jgi:CDP-glucose 4,6-dehydratase